MGSLRSLHQKDHVIMYDEIIRLAQHLFDESQPMKFTLSETANLIKILDNFLDWRNESNKVLLSTYLGDIAPDVLKIIAMSYATSIMPIVSSIQPIDKPSGDISYWKLMDGQLNRSVKNKIWSQIVPLDINKLKKYTENDIVLEINDQIATQAIKKIVKETKNSVSWPKTRPNGISGLEHKLSFLDTLEDASTKIYYAAGRGTVSFILTSALTIHLITRLPHFQGITIEDREQRMKNGLMYSPLYGYLGNIAVISCPPHLLDKDTVYCGWRGVDDFEAPLVYSPWRYLFVTDPLTALINYGVTITGTGQIEPGNKLMHGAGLKVVNPDCLCKIILED